ncbi:MAG: TadE/TadG family type IV pilus assembly protein [Gemmatimonadota bacterium]
MMPRLRRWSGDRRGQALVEFALVAPILLILLLGIVDFARAWNVYQVLTDAGREGARWAVVDNGSTVAEVQQRIIDAAANARVPLTAANITVTEGTLTNEDTTVTIDYTHRLRFMGVIFNVLTGSPNLNFSVVSTMRREF